MRRPHISISDILRWADAFHAHWGRWPNRHSGSVTGQIDLTWCGIDLALSRGNRGLPGSSSLPQLLAQRRGVRNRGHLPRFTHKQILVWADAHHRRTGQWPNVNTGPVHGIPGETWSIIDWALRHGNRGLSGGSSLSRLLAERRGVRKTAYLPRLTIKQILAWADAYHRRTGRWPTKRSGPIPNSHGETWFTIAESLAQGLRGLRKDSLPRLLYRERGAHHRRLSRLRVRQILAWMDAHRKRTGLWPTHVSGAIIGADGESWSGVHSALVRGHRGLPGGSSLYTLLREHRGVNRSVRAALHRRKVEPNKDGHCANGGSRSLRPQ